MTSPISLIASRAIGVVESVSPDEIYVLLDIDSPRNTALNTGVPTSFPRINSFVLLPNESGAVVGIVVWLGVERSAYPKRQGLKDFGLIDLPFPLRKMCLCPIGTLFFDEQSWRLERGVHAFPSVGDTVILPTPEQTIAIVTGQEKESRVYLGTCPSAHDVPISVDPDKLFGRHLAILGNTGSGKSCSVASLIRSSIECAQASIKDKDEIKTPNARFIILDPNGEYSRCFQDLGSGCRVFQVPPVSDGPASGFRLPAWMWNSSEWAAVAQAAPKTQRPLLQAALRNLRSGQHSSMTTEFRLAANCHALQGFLLQYAGKGTQSYSDNMNCGGRLTRFLDDVREYRSQVDSGLHDAIDNLGKTVSSLLQQRRYTSNGREGFNGFGDVELDSVVQLTKDVFSLANGGSEFAEITEDSPVIFDTEYLTEHLEALASQESNSASQFISTLTMRIRSMLSDARMKDVINPNEHPTLEEWLNSYIGKNKADDGQLTIIDLSLVPYEILHLVIAVSSRLILEALQRYRKINQINLPTVLVLEEAHTFVAKRLPHGEETPSPSDMCRQIFERIAREGRKFGLSLVLSSQRPSEISETVLSQCNSFLLHRITNDKDQELVSRLVPDTARGLLRELPSLPTKHCILLGIATKVPVLIESKNLSSAQRPQSDDPDFWDVWTGRKERKIDWKKVAEDWTGQSSDKGIGQN